jgi:methionyl-tRNA formyltransferase
VSQPRVVFFGYHSIGARSLAVLLAGGERVTAVFTHTDDPREPVWFESVAALARQAGIPVYAPLTPNTPEMLGMLRALEPDLFVSVYYRRLLSPEALALPSIAAVNLHGSLLPKYRGRAPLNWAIVNGERETGVTLHHMAPEADAGDIIAQAAVPVGPDDTAFVVYQRMIGAAEALLAGTYPLIVAGTAPRRPQDHRAATVFGARRPEDGRIEWAWSAPQIHNLVRAVTHPYPGAFTASKGRRLFVWETRLADATGGNGAPGIIQLVRDDGFVVKAGVGRLLVRSVQAEGGREVAAPAFLEQAGLRPGDVIGV